jgi:hypothetical protein
MGIDQIILGVGSNGQESLGSVVNGKAVGEGAVIGVPSYLVEEGEALIPKANDAGFTAIEIVILVAPKDKAIDGARVASESELVFP